MISSIEDVKIALLNAFWIGKNADIPTNAKAWCEIWLRVDNEHYSEIESSFILCCQEIQIPSDEKAIKFPERMVKLVYADAKQLEELICRFSYVAEVRPAQEVASFFEDISRTEQQDWVDDLLSRVDYDFSNATVCLLDTGVNSGHPLLSNAIEDDAVLTVESVWGVHDSDGHGTEMAGVALYNNLVESVLSTERCNIVHRIESVKILPPKNDNDPELYGAIIQRAVYLAEIGNPYALCSICIAVTSEKNNTGDGSPTSWSGAVDSIASGAYGKEEKRLLLISAGNVQPSDMIGYERIRLC